MSTEIAIQILGEDKFAKILDVAYRIRLEEEIFVEGDLTQLNNTCHFMSEKLLEALLKDGFEAQRVPGYYMGADDDFEPDMSEWDHEAIENFNREDGFSHWWIEVDGVIVDICVDQFHPSFREAYAVHIEDADSLDYQKLM